MCPPRFWLPRRRAFNKNFQLNTALQRHGLTGGGQLRHVGMRGTLPVGASVWLVVIFHSTEGRSA